MLSLLASHRVTFGLFHLLPSVRAAEGYTVVRERLTSRISTQSHYRWGKWIIATDAKYGVAQWLAGVGLWNAHKLIGGSAFGAAKIPWRASGHVDIISAPWEPLQGR